MIKGKVVLVPFPFDDLSSTKVRPAVCLTEPVGPHRQVVLAFVTSRIPEDPEETDILINEDHFGFREIGLRVSSTLRLHRLMTASMALLRRELGRLPNAMELEIDRKLRTLFGLT